MKKTYLTGLCILFSSLILTGCGGTASDPVSQVNSGSYMKTANFAAAPEMAAADMVVTEETTAVYDEGSGSSDSQIKNSDRKLIRTVDITFKLAEGQGLEESVSDVTETAERYGAYIESNNAYFDVYSSARIVVKVPEGDADSLLEELQSKYKTGSINDSMEDVTLHYTDVESRLEVKKQARDKYMSYLEDAETVEDIMRIETELNNVIADIESYESQLRSMDNLIDYTTINISLESNETSYRPGFDERWNEKFSEIGYNIGNEFIDGLAWFIEMLIKLIFILPIVIIVIRVIRFALGKKGAKKDNKKEIRIKSPFSGKKEKENTSEIKEN